MTFYEGNEFEYFKLILKLICSDNLNKPEYKKQIKKQA